jgi:pimeloyl-ACP methyl ester carboxylesterase
LIFFESFLKTSCSKNLQASCGRQAYALTTKALLVAVGEDDVMTPPYLAEEMANAIPGARLVRFAGSGHLPSMEVPEAVNAAIRDWLAD